MRSFTGKENFSAKIWNSFGCFTLENLIFLFFSLSAPLWIHISRYSNFFFFFFTFLSDCNLFVHFLGYYLRFGHYSIFISVPSVQLLNMAEIQGCNIHWGRGLCFSKCSFCPFHCHSFRWISEVALVLYCQCPATEQWLFLMRLYSCSYFHCYTCSHWKLLELLEPWCWRIYLSSITHAINKYKAKSIYNLNTQLFGICVWNLAGSSFCCDTWAARSNYPHRIFSTSETKPQLLLKFHSFSA